MICRLCLSDLVDFVPIFEEHIYHAEFSISMIIAKYFRIELDVEDTVSNKICNLCYNHLNEFHVFWLLIEEKQLMLQKEFLNVKCDLENDLEVEPPLSMSEDVKDVSLYEEPIDEVLPAESELRVEEFGSASTDEDDNIYDVEFSHQDNVYSTEQISKILEPAAGHKKLSTKSKHISTQRSNRLLQCRLPYKNKSRTPNKDNFLAHSIPNLRDQLLNNSIGKPSNQLKTDGSTKLKCKVCNKVSANKYALKKHMYRSHPSDEDLKYPCNLCVRKFAKKFLLDDHLNWHQEAEKRNTCEKCKKGFYSNLELKAHRKSLHANELKIICDCCGKSFKCKSGYENHYAAEHLGITRPEAQCQICKIWLKNDKVLYKHMYKHRDENSVKEFTCNVCGTVKPSKAKLSRHKSYHHPDKMHKCTLCNKEFKILIGLEEHMAVHNGQPLYSCCFCPQTFKSHANMYTHKRRIHPNEWVSKKAQAYKVVSSNIINTLEP